VIVKVRRIMKWAGHTIYPCKISCHIEGYSGDLNIPDLCISNHSRSSIQFKSSGRSVSQLSKKAIETSVIEGSENCIGEA
jgi:hypothetical protein